MDYDVVCPNCGERLRALEGVERWRLERIEEVSRRRWVPIALVAMCVVSVAIVGLALWMGWGRSSRVEAPPVYPGATEVGGEARGLPAGWTAKLYSTTASVDEVMDWYRTKMSGEGWTKTADKTTPTTIGEYTLTIHFLTFTKWDGAVWVAMAEGAPSFMLLWGPKEEMPAEIPW